jgi:hypothetical protein
MVKYILSVSPAFKTTEVVVIVQVLTTLDGPDVVDVPHDSVAAKMGNSRYRCAFGVGFESLDVTTER